MRTLTPELVLHRLQNDFERKFHIQHGSLSPKKIKNSITWLKIIKRQKI